MYVCMYWCNKEKRGSDLVPINGVNELSKGNLRW